MLETIREYATERSEESGTPAELRRRHAEWFADLGETGRPLLMSRRRRIWLDRIDQEHDNIRAAIAWAIVQPDPAIALRFIGARWRFWPMRGYLAEGHERALATLALEGVADHPRLHFAALEAAGGLAYWRANHAEARVL
jgi:predicted ATPase